jgi:hypothetical protein
MLSILRDLLGSAIFVVGFLVSLLEFVFAMLTRSIRWLRLTLYIESARLLRMPKAQVDALYTRKEVA